MYYKMVVALSVLCSTASLALYFVSRGKTCSSYSDCGSMIDHVCSSSSLNSLLTVYIICSVVHLIIFVLGIALFYVFSQMASWKPSKYEDKSWGMKIQGFIIKSFPWVYRFLHITYLVLLLVLIILIVIQGVCSTDCLDYAPWDFISRGGGPLITLTSTGSQISTAITTNFKQDFIQYTTYADTCELILRCRYFWGVCATGDGRCVTNLGLSTVKSVTTTSELQNCGGGVPEMFFFYPSDETVCDLCDTSLYTRTQGAGSAALTSDPEWSTVSTRTSTVASFSLIFLVIEALVWATISVTNVVMKSVVDPDGYFWDAPSMRENFIIKLIRLSGI